MQKDVIERFDDLSPESRKKLNKRVKRVQEEAQLLREETRQLRQDQQTSSDKRSENKPGEGLPAQTLRRSSRAISDVAVQEATPKQGLLAQILRGARLVKSTQNDGNGAASVGSLVQSGKNVSQNVLKRSGEITSSGLAVAGSQLKASPQSVLERKSDVAQNVADLKGETGLKLRKQGKHLAWKVDDLRDEAAYQLRKQGKHLAWKVDDLRDETTHKLRKQGRSIGHDLSDRREDARYRLNRQSRQISQGTGRLLKPMQKAWPAIGFFSGVLLAAGVTFWLVRRSLHRVALNDEQHIELSSRDAYSNELSGRPGGEIRYSSQGGTAVATRASGTSTEALSSFVGVQSTKKYYPIERKPDALDLVFFVSEEAARAEGFTAAR